MPLFSIKKLLSFSVARGTFWFGALSAQLVSFEP